MDTLEINQIFTIFCTNNPDPKTELNYTNNFTLLVAVVLSAQATDIGVNKATKELFKVVYTPEDMLKLGSKKLKQHIKSIGLFNTKAKNIIKLSQQLLERFNSSIPENIEDLQSLAGVGRKTANVILNCAFNKPTIAVDTHVFRTAIRIGLSKNKSLLEVERTLEKSIPKKWLNNAHHWLILHGRYTCKAKKPLCIQCPIKLYCDFYKLV